MSPTRREFLRGGLALAAVPATTHVAFTELAAERNTLWYATEAKRWLEAVPIGNGRIGGMVFGGVRKERVALTESTAWSGAASESDVNPGALQHIGEIRELLFRGEYGEARKMCEKHLLSHPTSFGTNLPLFDLLLEFEEPGHETAYRRVLDLETGIAGVKYRVGPHLFTRESFCSNPDQVLVLHLASPIAGQISFAATFDGIKIPGAVNSLGNDTLIFRGNAFERLHSNGNQGVEIECHLRLLHQGGEISVGKDSLQVKVADAVTLLVAIATNYGGRNPGKICDESLQAAAVKSYAELRRNHVADYRELFSRVRIDLGSRSDAANIPTDQRRRLLEGGASDPELCALFFQYGRYLTIAGSRSNSPLPLALQGIWNDGLASSMGWTDDFHLDINTEQNYWLAEVGNLSESQAPLFVLTEKLRQSGGKTAETMYGAPGWVSHVVTNPWGFTAPGWGLGWGIFVTSGIWIALQMWEHFRFNPDMEFLRERLYPIFKESAEFFLAYMVEHPKHGWLVTGPSDSPENAFRAPSGEYCSESMGPTCDRVLVYSLLSVCLEAEKLLSIDSDLGSKLQQTREKLPPLQIGRYGQLQEWLEDFEEAEPNHRHTSHLIALYPENQISPEKTPALAKAARVTLERRIHHPKWEDTEWSRANLVNYYARLWDGEAAHQHLIGLLSKTTEDNLLTYSRAGVAGASQNIFAIDGNTAGAAGIAEMLLESQGDSIHLLPALPSAWPTGSVSGLCARGGFEVDMNWRSNRLTLAAIRSKRGGDCTVRYGKTLKSIHVEAGQTVRLTARSFVT
ncbi:glycoside hydrolase family 95 protein [Tunturibacter empetritectus]|uniref:Alpha-L-fucosidase 2 n=1 Tax=Tunturiibacter empetritectus TaxID=3069691 RepID=A0A7W8IGU6_9BACT|nr:glycoside hydrolase family 95 protein [Edaphobacter lichenicola]MBB5316936.1 alpha-L-fucosidase 2 [Edaphobacter lichenicola]